MEITIRKSSFQVEVGQNIEAWSYINTGLWERDSFEVLDYFVKEKDVVIDLGCWSGVLSLYLAAKVSRVYALDPDPVCFAELLKNIELNPSLKKKIHPYRLAISDQKESKNLYARTQYGQSSSSLLARSRDLESSESIPCLSLLEFVQQEKIKQVDFIKMDVEGAEFRILPKIANALEAMSFPTLYISFHYHYLKEHIYHQKFSSKLLNKLLLKTEKTLGFSLLKKRIRQELKDLFKELTAYNYIYTSKGKAVSLDFLNRNPDFIKNHSLVFSNQEWILDFR